MKVVSVINYKGGVGKTTLTANLGAYAASVGRRVLMIDLDPQASLTFSFMSPDHWNREYADNKTLKGYFVPIVMKTKPVPLSSMIISLADVMRNPGKMKLDMVCSHLDLIDIDIMLSAQLSGVNEALLAANFLETYGHIRLALSELKNNYDLVLMDCPPNFYALVKNALLASDYYIVPAKLDYLSTLGINRLEHHVGSHLEQYEKYSSIRDGSGYAPLKLAPLGIVPMMVNIRKGDDPIGAELAYMDVMREGHYIFHYVRNNSSVFGGAPNETGPAVLTRPRFNLSAKRIVHELQVLGKEFLQKIDA